ncbi:hypothetical protein DL766_007971 [Monosporascus sp. MC13-8B]|uniref:Secreted protein n=1 Tax=Monosporascus cannonballus TaxID=155416 RepID=A0ABY0HJ68_9PEZI|nr:hypothetical protein DL762_000443 [Monosporascus cannonballus]RYP01120.1 hypothetical protein DL763_000357 [Monosporascus cannonballus]RYP21321.1 hypothetical protein DL766_007971 [Monosporascus sp. MC13-8B]
MRPVIALLLPALVAATPIDWEHDDKPDEKLIKIISASASGNGCPQGTVTTSLAPDGTESRTPLLEPLDATYIGPGTTPADWTKNCQLHLNLQYPGGFQFAVVESTYHGYAQLDAGVTGTFLSTYYFSQDAGSTTTTRTSIQGGGPWALGQVYTKQDKVPTAAVIWSPCGATGILNVNNRIALTSRNSSAYGQISDDDATVAFTQQVHVDWQPCKK